VLRNLAGRLVDGTLVVAASEHRSQHRNRVAARERMAELLRDALAPPPPPRRATRPSRASQQRRLDEKRRRGEIKSGRGRVRDP
jgi:ribosome-associated protein